MGRGRGSRQAGRLGREVSVGTGIARAQDRYAWDWQAGAVNGSGNGVGGDERAAHARAAAARCSGMRREMGDGSN